MYGKATVKILQVLSDKQGVSKTSGKQWRNVRYLAEVGGMRPYSFVFSRMMREDEQLLGIGSSVTVDIVVEARPYSGEWYNDVKCIKVE